MERRTGVTYGKGLRLPDLYSNLPHIDEEDSEFMFDVFSRAKEMCQESKIELTGNNLLKQANIIAIREHDSNFHHSHGVARWQFNVSLSDPGLEVMRYLPRIAARLGMNVEREFKPLWEYINPDFMTRLTFRHWNIVSHMLDDLPDLSDQLRNMDEKPEFFLMGNQLEHGITASVLGEGMKINIRGNLDQHDLPNAQFFAKNLGPKIVQATDRWILEEYFDMPQIEDYDLYDTKQPYLYGNLLGSALSQIHASGYSYNSSLHENVFVDPAENKLKITNWCHARKDGNTNNDLEKAQQVIQERYLYNLAKPANPHAPISSYGSEPYIKAMKGFYKGYKSGNYIPLNEPVK